MKRIICLLVCSICLIELHAQGEKVIQTFRDTRVINSHSVETVPGGMLDFRITHRFGDIAGDAGGWNNFYGLENASDIAFGLEYGLTDNINVGLSRTKGSGPLKANINSLLKFRIITQETGGNQPISLTWVWASSYSTMQKSASEGVLHYFPKSAHRLSYHMGLHWARKFSERLSLQFNAAWTYRNIVPSDDKNDLVSVGGAFRFNFGKSMGLIGDVVFPISDLRTTTNGYYPSLAFGLEFDTSGGHVFQVNVTNTTGIHETDFIPYTRANWGDGEFRLGFTISRLFNL